MKKNNLLSLFFSVMLITSFFGFGLSLTGGEVLAQTSIVSCVDTENAGSGVLRARICQTADCAFNNYQLPSTTGSCTVSNGGGSGGINQQ